MTGRYPPPPATPTPRTMPVCGGSCGRSGVVLFMGVCERCTAAEERNKEKDQ